VIRIAALLIALLLPLTGHAQTNLALGGITTDPDAPVEVTADSLAVDQDSRTARFSGNVVIGQGALRVSAAEVEVFYDEATGQIARFVATGGVTLATATEAAESWTADYDLVAGLIVMSGDVFLTQGQNALSAETMTVNLRDGTAQMQGRVRTVFQTGGN
jgi:lipopolysaccharide export system protein LptA